MNDTLLELVDDDPLGVCEDLSLIVLTGPLDRRLEAVLAVLPDQG